MNKSPQLLLLQSFQVKRDCMCGNVNVWKYTTKMVGKWISRWLYARLLAFCYYICQSLWNEKNASWFSFMEMRWTWKIFHLHCLLLNFLLMLISFQTNSTEKCGNFWVKVSSFIVMLRRCDLWLKYSWLAREWRYDCYWLCYCNLWKETL